jgi:hypothetical protein
MEMRFFNQRNKIRESKILEITEYSSSAYLAPCVRDSAEIRFKYKFDDSGNLLKCEEYRSGILEKTIVYTRNVSGEYDSKEYVYPNELKMRQQTQKWSFEYNHLGKRIREIWKNGDETWRINDLSYDSNGNLSSVMKDSIYKWTFEYDDNGNVIERREWELRSSPIRCLKLIKYTYKDNRLISEITQSPIDFEIWKDVQYQYDPNGNLISIFEIRTFWRTKNNSAPISEFWHTTTILVNEEHGFPIQKSESVENNNLPAHCFFYEYKYKQ